VSDRPGMTPEKAREIIRSGVTPATLWGVIDAADRMARVQASARWDSDRFKLAEEALQAALGALPVGAIDRSRRWP
jgi:hypothetical protein